MAEGLLEAEIDDSLMEVSEESPNGLTVIHGRSPSFYDSFFRKGELPHQTHYCPGCGHGVIHKLIAQALDKLALQDRTVLVSPVGCSVFAYYYFDVGNIQAAHGRASAVATAAKRARPGSIVLCYQGDGDMTAIGLAEIMHAANRGENITVIFVNNAIYGMTGGQMAPTTLIGQTSTTTPHGRTTTNEGFPLHMCEVLAALEGPVYLERVALSDNKGIMKAARAVHKAIENQARGLGFSLVEVLSPCPTIWKKDPIDAQRWVREVLMKAYVPGVYRDRTKEAVPVVPAADPPPLSAIPAILEIEGPSCASTTLSPTRMMNGNRAVHDALDLKIRVAGFGGQGVLLLGEILAEAGMTAGLDVSWLPSYGPEMRSGTSNCHVRLSANPVDSPMVTRPNVLLAMNEPSLRKFLPTVDKGGVVFYNGESMPADCAREDVTCIAQPFVQFADTLGSSKAGNMVILGAFLETLGAPGADAVDAALRRYVSAKWLELDRQAIAKGREYGVKRAA
jgi:2-oxoisovalerate ferredoxin oxidoreductase beta subunit